MNRRTDEWMDVCVCVCVGGEGGVEWIVIEPNTYVFIHLLIYLRD